MIGGTAAALASSADLLLHSKERNVAMLVVLLDDPTGEFSLSQDLVTSLAQLGVTNAALVRDEQTAGIVLEGSLFDPARSAEATAAAVGAESTVRVLRPRLLSPDELQGEHSRAPNTDAESTGARGRRIIGRWSSAW